jgi:hypothetical protein
MSNLHWSGVIGAADGILRTAKFRHGATFSTIDAKATPAIYGHGPPTAAMSSVFAEYRRLISTVTEQIHNSLQNGKLRAFFFNRRFGNVFRAVPSAYWSKPESLSLLERVFFEAIEFQSFSSQPAPRDSFYFMVGELDELLVYGFARKSVFLKDRLDKDGKRYLADVLQRLSEQYPGLRRPDQAKLVREHPDFRRIRITERDLREAARQAPLPPGRPRKT